MSNTSSKSTSSEASDYQRRKSRSQPLDELHLPASESGIGEEMTSSTVGEMGTTKETASIVNSDSDQTPVFRIVDDTDIIQSSEVNRQDEEEDHNLAVDTHEEESVTPEQLVLSSSQKSGGDSIKSLEVGLATYRLNESELQEEVDHLREENEKLEHQLIDKEKENQKKIGMLLDQQSKLKSTVTMLQYDHRTEELERREFILSLKKKLNEKNGLEIKQSMELCNTQVKLAKAELENALLRTHKHENALLKERSLMAQAKHEKALLLAHEEMTQANLKHKKALLLAHKEMAHEKALLVAHKERSLTPSSSTLTSGVESMDERSESNLYLYEDRKRFNTELLEALDTLITGPIESSNEPFGKYPISGQYNVHVLYSHRPPRC